MKEVSKKKIFLSHSYQDKEIATKIVEKLLVPIFTINKQADIFFTSKRETGIESSINWRNRIKTNLQDCDIFIALITANFKDSEMCLGEIGAAWVLNKKIYPLIIPPIKYENFSPVIAELQADLLLNREDIESFINSLKEQLKNLFGINIQPNVDINKCITAFLKSTKEYLQKNPSLFKLTSLTETKKQDKIAKKEISEILENADTSVSEEEKNIIKSRSKTEWPDDYSMQEYYINEQIHALENIKKLKNEVKNHVEKARIVDRAVREWPQDYTMQIYKANEEIEAYSRLQ